MGLGDTLERAVDKLNGLIGQGDGNWEDKLQPANFDGIPLKLIEAPYGGSFNVTTKTFYGTREPWSAQTGRNAKHFAVSLFTSGKNWAEDRNALIKALDKGGFMAYVDPFMGQVTVLVESWDKAESLLDGRYCAFAVNLIQTSKTARGLELAAKPTKDSLLQDAAELFNKAVDTVTDAIDLVGQPASIITSAVNRVQAELSNAYRRIKGSLLATLGAWQDLIDLFIPGKSGSGAFTRENYEAMQQRLMEADYRQAMALAAPLSGRNEADGTNPKADNTAHLKRFFNESLLAVAITRVAETDFTNHEDALFVKEQLLSRLADAGLRSRVGEYLDTVAMQLPSLVEFTPFGTTSTLDMAQRFYDDPDRAEEIRQRNNVAMPMAVTPKPLLLLDS